MKRILFTFILLMLFCTSFAQQERNFLTKALETLNLNERLLINQEWVTFPSYGDSIGWEKLLGENKVTFINEGEKFINYQWVVVKATDYLEFTRSGNRSVMESAYNSNLVAVTALFLAELTEGKGRFTDQLINGVFSLCEMTTWSLSAHLYIQKVKGSFPDNNDQVIDLVAGDTGSMLAWIHYFFKDEFDKVTPLISARILCEIDKRIMTPYLERSDYWWQGLAPSKKGGVNNWNPWCNFNVLQCFLLLEKDRERLIKAVKKTASSVDKFINQSKEDGACEEGPSYWGLAAGKMYDYLQLLYNATSGSVSLFDKSLIKNMGEYIPQTYVANKWVVNFADASARQNLDYHLIYLYGSAVNSSDMLQLASYLRSNFHTPIRPYKDIFRTLNYLLCDKNISTIEPKVSSKSISWFSQTEFCYIRNEKAFFAAKGGHNGESHNHNDVGTFSLYIDGQPTFIDVGVERYTGKTFGPDRYSIWTMQSDYHNLPKINGHSQKDGSRFHSERVSLDEKSKTFSIDIAKAYPEEAKVEYWNRTYNLKESELIINDAFKINDPLIPNRINFMLCSKPEVRQDGVLLINQGKNNVELQYNAKKLKLIIEPIVIKDSRLLNIWGETIYRLSFTALKTAKEDTYVFKIRF